MVKHCVFNKCKSVSKSKDDPIGKEIFFIPFPKPATQFEKCKRWLAIINRDGLSVAKISHNHYVCSLHFHGGKGPTPECLDPIPNKTEEPVCVHPTINRSSNRKTYSHHVTIENEFETQSVDALKNGIDMIQNLFTTSNVSEIVTETEPLKDTTEQTSLQNLSSNFTQNSISIIQNPTEHHLQALLRHSLTENQKEEYICATSTSTEDQTENVNYSPNTFEALDASLIPKEEILEEIKKENTPYTVENLRRDFFLHEAHTTTPLFWNVITQFGLENLRIMKISSLESMTQFITVEISPHLELKVLPFNKPLEMSHDAFLLNSTTISSLPDLLFTLEELDSWSLCKGLDETYMDPSRHNKSVFVCKTSHSLRSTQCELIFKSKRTDICQKCRLAKIIIQKRIKRMKSKSHIPKKANNRYLNTEEIGKKIAATKLRNRALEKQIARLQNKITGKKSFMKGGFNISTEDSLLF